MVRASLVRVLMVAGGLGCAEPAAEPGPSPESPPPPAEPLPLPSPPAPAEPVEVAPPVDPGSLDQTNERPTADDPAFLVRMQGLVDAVQRGDPSLAHAAFFPKAAYVRLKTIPKPDRDFDTRLLAAFDRDLTRLHTDDLPARVVRVAYDDARVRWMNVGTEYNTIGYHRLLRATLIYEVGGVERTIPITSLISWRGQWYVVHLSAME